jgi:arsenate reductase|tara:strand:- start:1680 stop:2117 length:438 start_codon:yes stop_codon:yes gene_type:complete
MKNKNILFVCTGNSARSIIAESIIKNKYHNRFNAFSAGSNPTGKVNEDVKNYLISKNFNLLNCRSKNFDEFTNNKIKIDYVITVCNNANNEICPVWPKKDEIIHWDIEDPVVELKKANNIDKKKEILDTVFNKINKKIQMFVNEK